MNDIELSYLAGLFDGEGSAGVYIINRKGTKWHPRTYRTAYPVVQLRMTDAEPVRAFHKAFGGWFGMSKPKDKKQNGDAKKLVYEWRISHRPALAVARALVVWCRNPSKVVQFQKIIDHYAQWVRPIKGQIRYPVNANVEHDPKPKEL